MDKTTRMIKTIDDQKHVGHDGNRSTQCAHKHNTQPNYMIWERAFSL
jgi:hypothetical protein